MLLRYQDVLFRVARSACRPGMSTLRTVSTTTEIAKPKTKRGRPKKLKDTTETEVQAESVTKTLRTKKTKKIPAKKIPKAKSATSKVQPVEAQSGDLLSRLQTLLPWRTRDPKTRSGRAPASILEPGRVHIVGEKLCGMTWPPAYCPGLTD
jgi:hypothetical protein